MSSAELLEWVKTIGALICSWPPIIAFILVIFRKPLFELIRQFTGKDVKKAKFGPVEIERELGSAPKLKQEDKVSENHPEHLSDEQLQNSYYLIHAAKFARVVDGKDDYSITLQLDTSHPRLLEKVTKVAYHLHSSYYPRDIREATSPDNHFELKFYAWGQFNLYADVYIEGREQPITVWRYINF